MPSRDVLLDRLEADHENVRDLRYFECADLQLDRASFARIYRPARRSNAFKREDIDRFGIRSGSNVVQRDRDSFASLHSLVRRRVSLP